MRKLVTSFEIYSISPYSENYCIVICLYVAFAVPYGCKLSPYFSYECSTLKPSVSKIYILSYTHIVSLLVCCSYRSKKLCCSSDMGISR